MTDSPFQLAIYDVLAKDSENVIVEAVPGSGKSTTIRRALPRLRRRSMLPLSINYLVFNKNNALAFQPHCPPGTVCSTFHSAAFGPLKGAIGRNVQVDAKKVQRLVWDRVGREFRDTRAVIKLVGLMKTLPRLATFEDAKRLLAHYDVMCDDQEATIEIALETLKKSNADLKKVDFDDMLYLAVLLNVPFPAYDWVFVDEAQDTNDVQIEILARMLRSDSRFCAVGDPNQAIYGFRGALSDSMTRIQTRFACRPMPLSICYRCSKSVVREANRVLGSNTILPWDGAPEGIVDSLARYRPSDFSPGSACLCRNTAPLVKHAYGLLQRDVPCVILGRDIGATLRSIVEKMHATDLDNFLLRLGQWRDREIARLEAEDRSPETILDQYQCLVYFVQSLDEDAQRIDDLLAKIDLMFTDDLGGRASRVTLSTIHKAKGMEYPKVFLLDRELLPSKWAKQPWQLEQEKNLELVAVTRAQLDLFNIHSDMWQN